MSFDGPVSRHVNRRLSRPLGRLLARTPVTPNQLTVVALAIAAAAGALTAAGWFIAGGLLIQAASVFDGVDGEVARAKGMATRFGAFLDSLTDRYADAFMLAGMATYAVRFEDGPRPELAGALALAGTLVLSYSRARVEASLGQHPPGTREALVFGLASRDVRSLVMAAGTVVGLCYWTLWVVAAMTALTVAWRLVYLRAKRAALVSA